MIPLKFLMVTAFMIAGNDSPLDTVANRVAEQIVSKPGKIASLYHDNLLRQISEKKLKDLYTGFYKKHGKVVSVAPLEKDSPYSGKFTFNYQKDVRMTVTLTVANSPPHKVIGIFFSPPTGAYKNIGAVVNDLKELPGTVSFQLAELGDEINVLHEVNSDTSLAIGSTFKLYILAAIVQGRIGWEEIVKLDPQYKSLPSGALHTWPDGAPLTVHSLASAMISVSDNTATDHLLHLVGRERVESMMVETGNRTSFKTIPLLTTMEMFKLKSDNKLLKKYVKANESGRRSMLEGKIRRFKRDKVRPFADGVPVAIDTVEWFASAADLCRLMDWFRKTSDQTSLGIININKGLSFSKDSYEFVGYKGGSEPGVLNMTWLVETKSGKHYALSGGWNNPGDDGVDLVRFTSLLQPVIDLMAKKE